MNKMMLFIAIALLGTTESYAASLITEMNDWVGNQLLANNNSILSYLFLLVGGLAASLLPCVYPLYPITINILKSRGGENEKILHPIVYFLGIISMYFLFGVIAGTTGGSFNEVLKWPLTNIGIAVILILLGLSSAELLRISIFSGSSGHSQRKGVLGTYLMGLSAGLLSSACVGPVVVSILIGIVSHTSVISFSAILNASLKLLVFGIGVGMPFLIIGVLGAKLPKAGRWMKYVQYVFAGLILYFSYSYLEKGLLGYGFESTTVVTIAVGSLLLVIGAYQLQKSDLFPHQKMRNALYILTTVIGGLFLFQSIVHRSTAKNPFIDEFSRTIEQKGNLTWFTEKEAAYAEAKKSGKLVFLDFHGNWCTNCKAFQKLTQEDEELNQALQNAVLYKIYDTSEEFKTYRDDPRFPELKVGLPFFVITDTEGNMLYKTNDYLKTEEMILFLTE